MSLDLSRRTALKLLSANIALIAAGCGKPPEEVLPYVHMPERLVPGVPLQFATTLPLGGYGRGVLCTSYDGRPIKVSGNPLHPASLGSTDLFAEAHVLSLYDPDRSQAARQAGQITAFVALQTALSDRMAAWRGGADVRLLTGPLTSPTLLRQIDELRTQYPGFHWHVHDPLDDPSRRDGATLAFGRSLDALPRWAEVSVAVMLDADPLGPGPAQVRNGRGLGDIRRVRAAQASMARLYVFESVPTVTGAKADHRWSLPPHEIARVAVALGRSLGADLPDPVFSSEQQAAIVAVAADLQAAEGHALVAVGPGHVPELHALVHWINGRLRAPVTFVAPVLGQGAASFAELIAALESGGVDTLVSAGCNPVYDAPGDSGIGGAIGKAKLSLHHGLYVDETAARCGWHLPESHPLESWGDLRGPDGTASPMQPLISPLYETRTTVDLLECLAGRFDTGDHDTVRATWAKSHDADTFEPFWRRSLHDGIFADGASAPVDPGMPQLPAAIPLQAMSGLVLRLQPDPTVFDGSFSNNAWLQECPKPLSKEVWGHSLGLSVVDAARLGIGTGDAVRVTAEGRSVDVRARVETAQAEGTLALTLGYGRERAGVIGSGLGANGFALRSAGSLWTIAGVEVANNGGRERLLSTQEQFVLDGDRDQIFPVHDRGDLKPRAPESDAPVPSFYPPHDDSRADARWAMVIDAGACIGCNACVLACQVENNVPVVGPSEIANNRDMHWLRIDAYALEGSQGQVGFQPVPCMHCENAPCEPVCPVGASIHDSEGLNVQVYNRCVGTRFCQANCPYKVRHFNFYGYADGQQYGNLGDLVMQGHNNPDVSVRAQGVMEKCTYCVQRISGARREAEKEGRALREGDVTTACQNACPTQAIAFGNLVDRDSAVVKLREEPQHFTLLGHLNTKPRTTYLADVRNPNPALQEGER